LLPRQRPRPAPALPPRACRERFCQRRRDGKAGGCAVAPADGRADRRNAGCRGLRQSEIQVLL